VNHPSPRLVDAVEQLARQLHPEAFLEDQGNKKDKPETRPLAPASDKPRPANLAGNPLEAFPGVQPTVERESSCAH
jgi:hypothetical protein